MISEFPNFTTLTIDDRELYESMVKEYPPYSDISFTTLHIWWDVEGKLEISQLNGNLIIKYYQPFDEENSGLSVIGINKLEETIKNIFDWQKLSNEKPKLIHVPEFTVNKILNLDNFDIKEEEDYKEYILDSEALSKLEGSLHGKNRRRINKFIREVEGKNVELKQLDMSDENVKRELVEAIVAWEDSRGGENDPDKTERVVIKKVLDNYHKLGMMHEGLYIDGKLSAIILFHNPNQSEYYVLNHIKVDYSTPYIFDYLTHHIAGKATEKGIKYLNMEMDLGIENLREHKMGLRPIDFFRKFTITPK